MRDSDNNTGMTFWEKKRFFKMVLLVLAGTLVVFLVARLVFVYEPTNLDIIASICLTPVAAYLLHVIVQ